MTGDLAGELALDVCARLLGQDRLTLRARSETGAVLGALTLAVTRRDPDGLPVAVSVERTGG